MVNLLEPAGQSCKYLANSSHDSEWVEGARKSRKRWDHWLLRCHFFTIIISISPLFLLLLLLGLLSPASLSLDLFRLKHLLLGQSRVIQRIQLGPSQD